MNKPVIVELTPLQVSHTLLALKEYSERLLTESQTEPAAGEHEDYLVALSAIAELEKKR